MLPSVAHQPHHLLPHHHNQSFYSSNFPYGINGYGLPSLQKDYHPQQHGNMLPASHYKGDRVQCPRPIQQPDVRPTINVGIPGNTPSAEHTLRRKTPNGTLAAGYDATPSDRSIQPPATKHLLVSLLDNQIMPQSRLPMGSLQSLPSTQLQGFSSIFKQDPTRTHSVPNGTSHDLLNNSWIRSLNQHQGMDSILAQGGTIPAGQRYYWQNVPTVPTVLASSYQTGLAGPESGGGGQYGPYWPDGGFIPYRPAAYRDTRYMSTPSIGGSVLHGNSGPFADQQSLFNRQSLPPSELVSPGFNWNSLPPQSNLPMHQPFYGHDIPRHQQHFHPSHGPLKGPDAIWEPNPISYQPPQNLQDPHLLDPTDPLRWQRPVHNGLHSSTIEPISTPRSSEFKEKTLAWAHSVYVDLLASLHSARKKASQAGVETQSRDALKPSIYPKPPRQPGSDFSAHSDSSSGPIGNNAQRILPSHPQRSHSIHINTPSPGFFDAKRVNCHRPAPSVGSFMQNSKSMHMSQPFNIQTNPDSLMSGYNTIRRGSGTSVSRMFSPTHDATSINEKAATALDMLASLCKESDWAWIDGMLVGGCLAYGLADYTRAMRWYTRIIKKDSTHVEAISNLAATLLALDRREEALQHWLRAIKLRPSYFEAVEHLVGLLCSSQRGRDAVNIIQCVENALRLPSTGECFRPGQDDDSDAESVDRESSVSTTESMDKTSFDYVDSINSPPMFTPRTNQCKPDFGSSGFSIPNSDNGRILGLIHAKGNMLYALGDNAGAAKAFEDAILIGTGKKRGMQSLIRKVLSVFSEENRRGVPPSSRLTNRKETILLFPDKALQTAKLVFSPYGELPGFQHIPEGLSKRAAISTTSNSLLSLAKIYQDGMSSTSTPGTPPRSSPGVRDILALYYLSLSLQPSPSTANNVGILLAGIQGAAAKSVRTSGESQLPDIPGVIPGSGISLALAYYNYGLNLDSKHAHLYTNLGSLLKDIGQLPAAIKMYEQAVQCDSKFDIALANLANAVKDSGRINDAINYYRRAVNANPDFAEAVCGLANALNSVCNWGGRGGIAPGRGITDLWHVDEQGRLRDANTMGADSGWIKCVVDIVDKQLRDGELWGCGTLLNLTLDQLYPGLAGSSDQSRSVMNKRAALNAILKSWAGKKWEGSRVVHLIQRIIKYIGWQWYQDRYIHHREYPLAKYTRPQYPNSLTPPNAPTVLPFHTFTCPLSAKQIRHISQRNGLRISCSTLRAGWLPTTVYQPPPPPSPQLKVGYVSSDFNNHPLAHLMQSVFGLHNPHRVKAYCYATTASDNSVHRQQIEREAPVFNDVSNWPVDRLVEQIVKDGIHILVNLNGYTRGARNEVFAARPAPIQMSFMGFAGTLGAEWSDYILADELSIPVDTLAPRRITSRLEDQVFDPNYSEEANDWVYNEKIVYTKHTFFCCDHRQSAPDSQGKRLTWPEEQAKRWEMRKEMFPDIKDDTIILGNFNQLYKIEPTTFRTWLRILAGIPNAILWLLRFPDVGEQNLRQTAVAWAGEATASRIIFTDVAPKHAHISRARVCDLFLDTPECNAHTTAADILWSGTPLLTFPRYKYKMCSRMASSILSSALPQTEAGRHAANQLITSSETEYERTAIDLGLGLKYELDGRDGKSHGQASGRLFDLRKMLFLNRWESKLFDTRRWVNDLEEAYEKVWANWVQGEEKDIWL